MKKYVVVCLGILACTGSAAFGWHTRITNKTNFWITVKEDIGKLGSRENFYVISPNSTFTSERGAACLKGISVYADTKEIAFNVLKPFTQKGLKAVVDLNGDPQKSGLVASYAGKALAEYGKQLEADFIKESNYVATYVVPLSARCQHWDFKIEMDHMDANPLKILKGGHVFGGHVSFP